MRQLAMMGVILGSIAGLMVGCGDNSTPQPVKPGGIVPGELAAKRAVTRLFRMIQLEERDRAFGMLDDAYQPILESLKTLDASSERLRKALKNSGHGSIAAMLEQKRLTLAPGCLEIVAGDPNCAELKSDGKKAVVKVQVALPDGKCKEAWASMTRKEITWKLKLPLADAPDAKPGGPSPSETRAAVDKAVAAMKPVIDDLAARIEATEMIEETVITEKLTTAARPLAAALQRMVYGETKTQ